MDAGDRGTDRDLIFPRHHGLYGVVPTGDDGEELPGEWGVLPSRGCHGSPDPSQTRPASGL